MKNQECIAMILSEGQGSDLTELTTQIPESFIPFGGSYRLVDFSLSNCFNSGIETIGVLNPKQPLEPNQQLDAFIAQDSPRDRYKIHVLPPTRINRHSSNIGTADAIYKNIGFIESYSPEYVLILPGNHVYKMDYSLLLEYHKKQESAATISVIEVPWSRTPRFETMSTSSDSSVAEFSEKPLQPKSNLVSMGIYIFSWSKLKEYLELVEAAPSSNHDFGENIIPTMLKQGEKICTYLFNGYWKDVTTVKNLYEAHMDLLSSPPIFDIQDGNWPIYSTLTDLPLPVPVTNHKRKSLLSKNCIILGEIEKSIVFPGTYIGNNAKVKNSVIMPGAYVGHGAYVERAIIGPGAAVENGCHVIGGIHPIAVVGQNAVATARSRRWDITNSRKFG